MKTGAQCRDRRPISLDKWCSASLVPVLCRGNRRPPAGWSCTRVGRGVLVGRKGMSYLVERQGDTCRVKWGERRGGGRSPSGDRVDVGCRPLSVERKPHASWLAMSERGIRCATRPAQVVLADGEDKASRRSKMQERPTAERRRSLGCWWRTARGDKAVM
jgi:hypothetical protein